MRTHTMIPLCSLLLLPFVTPQPGMAQMSVGVRAGVNHTGFTGSQLDSSWKNGYTAGVFMTQAMVDELSFQAEAFYTQKGARVTLPGGTTPTSATIDLEYVQVAAMLRLDLPLVPGTLSGHLVGGPAAGLAVRCSVRPRGDGDQAAQDCDGASANLAVRPFDLGLLSGAGVDLSLAAVILSIEGRYEFGVGTIDADGAGWDRTNQALSVVAGIAIPVRPRRAAAVLTPARSDPAHTRATRPASH